MTIWILFDFNTIIFNVMCTLSDMTKEYIRNANMNSNNNNIINTNINNKH